MSAATVFWDVTKPPEPTRGESVRVVPFHNGATRGWTHEVRQVPRKDQISGFSLFFGSKKDCQRFVELHALQADEVW